MKSFLFTSADRDNQPEVVKAKTKQDAIETLALHRLSEDLIEQYREDNEDKLDTEIFRMAFKSEIDYVKEWYDIQEIKITTASSIKPKTYGKYSDDVRHAVGNL